MESTSAGTGVRSAWRAVAKKFVTAVIGVDAVGNAPQPSNITQMRMRLVLAASMGLVVATSAPAHAAVAAAVPGSYVAGWATPVIVAPVGGPVTVANTDIAPHQLVARSYLPKKIARKTSWCKSYSVKSCPLFWSETLGTGDTVQIQGLENIVIGGQYPFVCAIHSSMTGTLVGV